MSIDKQALRQTAEKAQEHGVFNMDVHSETVLALLDELESDKEVVELQRFKLERQAEDLHQAKSLESIHREKRFEVEREFDSYKHRAQENSGRLAGEVIRLEDELEAAEKRVSQLTAERDALRECELGNAKHSNTRAAADIYFQLVEECEIPAGGSLVGHVDDMRQRIAELEARTLTVKLPTFEGYVPHVVKELQSAFREQMTAACAAADIKLQMEGE